MPQVAINEPTDPDPRAEVRLGGHQDEPRHLAFKIAAIKPSSEAPFHIQGGEWTYLDCQGSIDTNVAFTVGVFSKGGEGNARFAWGNAVLIVKDQEAGGRFVELFSRAFSGKLPKQVKRSHTPGPFAIKTAILGLDMHREVAGGFSGSGGGWIATKWFPDDDGQSGEVFFSYNLARRQGEFSEKDADYADDLAAVFASALRDGSRPERTPEIVVCTKACSRSHCVRSSR